MKKKYVVKLQPFPLYDLGLTSLSLFSASKEIPFKQEFSKEKTNYEALIPFSLNAELDVVYKINYPLAKVEIKKEPANLDVLAGAKQIITINIAEAKYGLSKQYVIKCVRQSLDENTNIESLHVLNKKAYRVKDGEFYSLVPFKMSQKDIEKNIIVTAESSVANVEVVEADSSQLSDVEGARKNYNIKVTAENTSKIKNYTLILERGKPLDVKVESVSVRDIIATKKIDGSFFLFLPESMEATKIENDVKLTFEGGEEYSL